MHSDIITISQHLHRINDNLVKENYSSARESLKNLLLCKKYWNIISAESILEAQQKTLNTHLLIRPSDYQGPQQNHEVITYDELKNNIKLILETINTSLKESGDKEILQEYNDKIQSLSYQIDYNIEVLIKEENNNDAKENIKDLCLKLLDICNKDQDGEMVQKIYNYLSDNTISHELNLLVTDLKKWLNKVATYEVEIKIDTENEVSLTREYDLGKNEGLKIVGDNEVAEKMGPNPDGRCLYQTVAYLLRELKIHPEVTDQSLIDEMFPNENRDKGWGEWGVFANYARKKYPNIDFILHQTTDTSCRDHHHTYKQEKVAEYELNICYINGGHYSPLTEIPFAIIGEVVEE